MLHINQFQTIDIAIHSLPLVGQNIFFCFPTVFFMNFLLSYSHQESIDLNEIIVHICLNYSVLIYIYRKFLQIIAVILFGDCQFLGTKIVFFCEIVRVMPDRTVLEIDTCINCSFCVANKYAWRRSDTTRNRHTSKLKNLTKQYIFYFIRIIIIHLLS
jgi:hypothetical protein